MTGMLRNGLRRGFLLAGIAMLGVALLSGIHLLTRDRIKEQEIRIVRERLAQVLPAGKYNNDLQSDYYTVTDVNAFQHEYPIRVYRARNDGEPVAVVMEVIAADGYNGQIQMLAGIYTDGTISGVRVISHRETPGLGDPIEIRRSDWIEDFKGRSLTSPEQAGWAVRKDGGSFDQFTGATITPRAVVRAIHAALAFHSSNLDDLYRLPSEMQAE